VEQELRNNYQQLARSNRDLEDFAYVASHDLRAPLSGIDSAAKWLAEDLHDNLSDGSRKLLGLMRNRIDRMEKLLDDLLAHSRAGRTDTAVAETNVADMFANIVQILGPPAHIRAAHERHRIPDRVTPGRTRFRRLRRCWTPIGE
jgi:light-regulated signal transduction histidine kinase (bacteriophytochrome)